MKKFVKCFLLVVLILPCIFVFSACEIFPSKYVVGIERSANSTSIEQVYTITYSDGTTDSITIKNGEDGEDLEIEDIYLALKDRGYAGTFSEFVEEYLSIEIGEDNSQIIAKSLLSSVAITCQFPTISGNMFNQTKDISIGSGSGVIYKLDKQSGDAYIITNYHVVYNSSSQTGDKISNKIMCYTYGTSIARNYKLDESEEKILDAEGYPIIEYDARAIECSYVGGSMQYDIAVLKVTGSEQLKNSSARAVEFENSDNVQVGTAAIAIGNPEGDGISVTQGVVSVDSEYLTMTAADGYSQVTFRVMRIDTAVNSGNSGGGLYNAKGQVIGIVNAKIIDDGVENIGYAIPSIVAKRVADNIIKNASDTNFKVKKPTIGITLTSKNSRSVYDEVNGKITIVEDVCVTEVLEDSLAQSYGFLKDYVIKSVTIKGVKYNITRMYQVIDLSLIMEVGDVVVFEIEGKSDISVIISSDNITEII